MELVCPTNCNHSITPQPPWVSHFHANPHSTNLSICQNLSALFSYGSSGFCSWYVELNRNSENLNVSLNLKVAVYVKPQLSDWFKEIHWSSFNLSHLALRMVVVTSNFFMCQSWNWKFPINVLNFVKYQHICYLRKLNFGICSIQNY